MPERDNNELRIPHELAQELHDKTREAVDAAVGLPAAGVQVSVDPLLTQQMAGMSPSMQLQQRTPATETDTSQSRETMQSWVGALKDAMNEGEDED